VFKEVSMSVMCSSGEDSKNGEKYTGNLWKLILKLRKKLASASSRIRWLNGEKTNVSKIISVEIFDLIKCYASIVGSKLATFQNNLSVPSSIVFLKMELRVVLKLR
jgi:hypothetical protein